MALPTNTFRPRRYFRSKFREAKYLLAAEATDLQLESFEHLRDYIKQTFGDIAVGTAFKVEKIASDQLIIRPGEAWSDGIPFVLKSGTDAIVIAGDLPTGVTLSDVSRAVSDAGGKKLTFAGGCPNNTYAVVVEAVEEIVREAGSSGAVDPFLQGVNVGEGTEHKFRFVYKVHVIPAADLMSSPTYPLIVGTKHYVNEIEITPTGSNYYPLSSVDITPDINGADRQVTFKNETVHKLPYSTAASDFIFGKLVDSDGNVFTITSITTSDGGESVVMSLDREVAPGSVNPKSGLPVITTNVPYRLIKRDHYVTDSNGIPTGKRYLKVAEVTFATPVIGSPTDARIVSEVNTFGIDPNIRLREGGIISWDTSTGFLNNSGAYEITVPGIVGKAQVAAGIITLPSVGDVAYILLDRAASIDYVVAPTVVAKSAVPSNVDVYILAERGTSRVYFPHNGSIGDSESGYLGGFGSELAKDLSRDNLTDMLTEVQMDEVFAETFDLDEDVDFVNTQSMTFEQFLKQFKAGSSARFIDYHANTLPDADPTDPWTLLGNGAYAAVATSILTLTDSSIGDYVGYRRTESSLTPLSHSEHKLRMRMPVGTGIAPFTYMIQDGGSGKHFGLRWSTTAVSLVDGAGTVLGTFALDVTGYHTYELVKVGSIAVQWYVDGVRRGITKYSDIVTAGSANQIEWSTATAETATIDIDYVTCNIYTSIFQSKDIYRKGSIFYEGVVLPAVDTVAWTKVDGAGGITEVISGSHLVLTDAVTTNLINYYRNEAELTRHGDTEIDLRVKISSSGLLNFQKFGFRLEDGSKDIAVWLKDVAGQLRVAMHDGTSGTSVSSFFNLNYDEFVTIKIRKNRDDRIELLANNILLASHAYEEFSDTTSNKRITFGSFDVLSEYVATVDYIQYNLPGDGALAASPVRDFMAVVSSDDPSPIIWISSDGGITWFRADDRTTTSITEPDESGANLLVRIGLSRINSVLTDYGVYYNKTGFEVDGPFRFTTITATAGQTVFELPFAYTPGVNELIVSALYGTGDSRELFLGDDYTENDATHVTLTAPAALGDKFKFRVIFVVDPLVVPLGGAGFLGHDHDGSSGEGDILNPTEVNIVQDLNVGGYINGTSPLKLDKLNSGVTIGDGTLAAGELGLEIKTAAGAQPKLELTKGGTKVWKVATDTLGNLIFTPNPAVPDEFIQFSKQATNPNMIISEDGGTELRIQDRAVTAGKAEVQLEANANIWHLQHDGNSGLLNFRYNNVLKFAVRTNGQIETSSNANGSGTSGSWSTTSSAYQAVTNQSLYIATTGRPVKITVVPYSAGAFIGAADSDDEGCDAYFEIRRTGTSIGEARLSTGGSDTSGHIYMPPSQITFVDFVAAGAYIYTLWAKAVPTNGTVYVYNCRIVVEELN